MKNVGASAKRQDRNESDRLTNLTVTLPANFVKDNRSDWLVKPKLVKSANAIKSRTKNVKSVTASPVLI